MKQEKEYSFEEKISRFLDNSMSEPERDEFLKLISENKEYSDLLEEYKDIWTKAGNIAILRKTDASQDWEKVLTRMDEPGSNKNRPGNIRYLLPRIAALALILFATAIILARYVINEPENILIATMDEHRSISLPDGSVIISIAILQLNTLKSFVAILGLYGLTGKLISK